MSQGPPCEGVANTDPVPAPTAVEALRLSRDLPLVMIDCYDAVQLAAEGAERSDIEIAVSPSRAASATEAF